MNKTALITGVAGQDGSYLANFLLQKKYQVIGLAIADDKDKLWRLNYFNIKDKIKLLVGNIADQEKMKEIIGRYQPDELYNLAGVSSVAKSWEIPKETFVANALAVVELLEILRRWSRHTRFFQASSAEIYGNAKGLVREETNFFKPLHPYGTAKLAAHLAVRNWREQYKLFAVNGILFNHESPLREDYFVTKVIAQGVAKILAGQTKKLKFGNINAYRDFGFAGDYVKAMWRMLNSRPPRDFVICSGKSFAVKDFIREAFGYAGIKRWPSYIETAPELRRKQEVQRMRGSNALIKKELGWRPTVTFKQLVKMMVDFEIAKINQKYE